MKTLNFFNRSLLLTLLALATLNLVACGQAMEFSKIDVPTSVSDPVFEDPTDPGEPSVEEPTPGEPTSPVEPTPDIAKVDLFSQNGVGGKVDILFVVDNSPSMQKEQTKLGQRLNAFMGGLKNTDWQIAFTSTDVSNGKYGIKGSLINLYGHGTKKVLTKDFADAETVFLKTVQRSEVASSDEQPLRASILAMEKHNSVNAEFFRADADLAIIVLSDEDEMSKGTSKFATKPTEVTAAFRNLFGTTKKLSVYGIVIQPGDVACYNANKTGSFQNASYGTFVTELARITSGLTGSICDADYSQTLVDIGSSVSGLSDYFTLSSTPIAGSVSVTLSPAQNIAWSVVGKKLSFATPPQDGSVIQVTYKVAP